MIKSKNQAGSPKSGNRIIKLLMRCAARLASLLLPVMVMKLTANFNVILTKKF